MIAKAKSEQKSFMRDDRGIAYGIYAVAMFILLAGTILVWFLPMYNQFLSIFNIFISQGMVSSDTSDAMQFIGYVLSAMVVFILLGVAAWGIVRALEKRKEQGT